MRHLLKSIAVNVVVLMGISVITFAVIHLAPGKPQFLDPELNVKVSAQAQERLIALYGLDKPLHEQYARWLASLARFDFGQSFVDGEKVLHKIAVHLPITLLLNILSLLFILGVGIPIGIVSALHHGKRIDYVLSAFVFMGFALPTFWIALIAMSYFGVQLRVLPVAGLVSYGFSECTLLGKLLDLARHLVLPVAVSSLSGLAGISQYMKSSFLDILKKDYIRTAYAKGLRRHEVLYRHALRNALLPVVTILGLSLPGLIGGSVIFESIFSIPGMGKLFFDSVLARDYPVIMAVLFLGALLTLAGNMCADICYALVDPRIRREGGAR